MRLPSRPGPFNQRHLLAKPRKLGHDLELAVDVADAMAHQAQRSGRRRSVDALLEEHRC